MEPHLTLDVSLTVQAAAAILHQNQRQWAAVTDGSSILGRFGAEDLLRLCAQGRDLTQITLGEAAAPLNKTPEELDDGALIGQLRQTERQLREAQRLAQIGSWELDLRTQTLTWSEGIYQIFELDSKTIEPSYALFLSLLPPEDAEELNRVYRQHLEDGVPYEFIHRFITSDGQVKYIRERCETEFSETGTPLLSRGTAQDVTATHRAQLMLKNLVEATATVTGENFFKELARCLAETLDADYALVEELGEKTLHSLGFWANGAQQENICYAFAKTPCQVVLERGEYYCQRRVQAEFPEDLALAEMEAESYLGVSVRNSSQETLGHLCILDKKPWPAERREEVFNIMRVFAARAGAELERQRMNRQLQAVNQELERKVAERTQSLTQLQARLEFILSSNPAVIFTCRPDGNYDATFVSENIQTITGYSVKDFLTIPNFWADRIHPEDQSRVFAGVPQLFERNYHSHDYRFRKANGDYIWIRNQLRLVRDAQGAPLEIAGYFADISAQKQSELERQGLLQELSAFKQALDQSAIVALTDARGIVTYVNDRFSEISGYGAEEILGKTHRLLKSGVHDDDFYRNLWEIISQGEIWRGEICNRAKDGHFYWLECTIIPFLDREGKPFQYLAVRFDLTQRKRAELAQAQSNHLLQAISKAQSQFITAANRLTIFEDLLENLLELTDSEYGFIGEVLFREDGAAEIEEGFMKIRGVPYLKTHSVTNIAWDEATRQFYEENYEKGMEFTNLNTLFGAVVLTGQPVIANNPQTDPRRGGLPDGHPPLNAFLGLPFFQGDTLLGMVGIANRPGGYDQEILDYLQPFLVTCSNLIEGYRIERRRKETQARLVEKTEELDRFFSVSLDLLCIASAEGVFIRLNQEWEQTLGYPLAELEGRNFSDFLHPDDKERTMTALRELADGQILDNLTNRYRCRDGSYRWLEWRAAPVDGLIYAAARDVTERKKYEAQLEASNGQLVKATRLKDEFLANMSHELRTPLNAILVNIQTLNEGVYGALNERQLRSLQTVEQSGQHLLSLINEILDLAKIEAGQMTLEINPAAVGPLCQSSLVFVKQQALRKRVRLLTDLSPGLPCLLVDERRIRQALINLLNNAVKFTPEGGQVTLSADFAEDPRFLRLTVTDTGIGIAPTDQKRLFQPFYQVDGALNRKYEGTGLGLALVKRIIDLHDGEVTLASEVGVGSSFSLLLPWGEGQAVEEAGKTLFSPSFWPAPTRASVLIAEHHSASLESLGNYLEEKGYRIFRAKDGEAALATVRRERPGLIILGVSALAKEGLGIIEGLRRLEGLETLPIIVLGGTNLDWDEERILAAGATDYLAKPFKLIDVSFLVQKYLRIV
ncbi:MAG: PAS domain-containing protein [Cyanobacteria bacterium RI_101]|nr:PAS domain-containing protein [Cyanobacteria bacterium RI_101]